VSDTPRPAAQDPAAKRLAVLIGSLHEAVLLEDETRHMQLVNQAFCDMFGIPAPPEALIGMDCSQAAEQSKSLFRDPESFVAGVTALLAARSIRVGDVLRMADGRVVERDYIPVFFEDNYRGHLWKYRDVTVRAREQARVDTLHAVADGLVDADNETAVCTRVLQALCAGLGWQAGTAFLPARQPAWMTGPGLAGAEEGLASVACVTADIPADRAELYQRLTASTMFQHDDGLIGAMWSTGHSSWIDDVMTFSGCARISQARAAQFGTIVFVPIRSGKSVHGVLEVAAVGERPLDVDVFQVLQEAGDRLGHVVERLRAQNLRRDQEAWTRTILDRMMEGLVVVSEQTGLIVGVNPMAERMFGFAAGTLIGHHIKNLLPDGSPRQDPTFLARAYERAINRTTEWEARRLDGSVFPMELQLTEFETGAGRVLVGFVRDLSERNAVERMKKQFVATVSHELRTPLTSVRGSLGLLATGALGALSPQAWEMVNLAERNVVRLVGLINDILDLERIESRGLRIALVPIPLDPTLDRAADAVRSMAADHGINLSTVQSGLHVIADTERLVQVVVNLLSNAVKFSPMGGLVEVSAHALDGVAHVEVSDRGTGVPEEFREIIFEPFRQVESSDTRQRGGSGLGLAISRAIVKQHGGVMGYTPRDGGGSTFWFTLPITPERS
jgi:PAS domain S-box-containing protein